MFAFVFVYISSRCCTTVTAMKIKLSNNCACFDIAPYVHIRLKAFIVTRIFVNNICIYRKVSLFYLSFPVWFDFLFLGSVFLNTFYKLTNTFCDYLINRKNNIEFINLTLIWIDDSWSYSRTPENLSNVGSSTYTMLIGSMKPSKWTWTVWSFDWSCILGGVSQTATVSSGTLHGFS